MGKAVVLLSGGIDSATTLAISNNLGNENYAMSFDYGQKNIFEIRSAIKIAKNFNVKAHIFQKIDLTKFEGSALTSEIKVPQNRKSSEMFENIPITYVPARNTIFLSFALAYAESIEADFIFIGVNAIDYSGYPDCRPEYIRAYQNMANFATKSSIEKNKNIKIETPLINKTKSEIIEIGKTLDVNYETTLSCYIPDHKGIHCGICDSCLIRKNAFKKAKISDPTTYLL